MQHRGSEAGDGQFGGADSAGGGVFQECAQGQPIPTDQLCGCAALVAQQNTGESGQQELAHDRGVGPKGGGIMAHICPRGLAPALP